MTCDPLVNDCSTLSIRPASRTNIKVQCIIWESTIIASLMKKLGRGVPWKRAFTEIKTKLWSVDNIRWTEVRARDAAAARLQVSSSSFMASFSCTFSFSCSHRLATSASMLHSYQATRPFRQCGVREEYEWGITFRPILYFMFRCLIVKLWLCGCQSFIKESYYYYYYYYWINDCAAQPPSLQFPTVIPLGHAPTQWTPRSSVSSCRLIFTTRLLFYQSYWHLLTLCAFYC